MYGVQSFYRLVKTFRFKVLLLKASQTALFRNVSDCWYKHTCIRTTAGLAYRLYLSWCLLINSDTGLNEVRPVSYSIMNSFKLVSTQEKATHF